MDLILSFTEKEVIGAISVLLNLVGYGAYLYTIIKGKTRPHVFSWIIWGIVNGIVFLGQHVDGAGPGAWVAGTTALICFIIVLLSLRQGDKHIVRSDWIAFIGAMATIPVWYFTKDPLGAVVLATVIDVLGCYPTFRKCWNRPQDENLFMWSVAAIRSFLSFFAIENYTWVTALFPVAMVFTNGGGACLIAWRRYILSQNK